MNKPKISVCICVWNTSHLLKRSIETYCNQDLDKNDWELIVIDDNSIDDVKSAIAFADGKINMRYKRLEHNFGMRGNTVAFNTAFEMAESDILAETTPETMFTPDAVRLMLEPHLRYDRIFVAMKTYNLTPEVQLEIDTVDWREDVSNIMRIYGFFNDWTLNNFRNTHFGTHQTCSIRKKTFYSIFPQGYPKYLDYGSEDAKFCGAREFAKIKDITIMQPMQFHQNHLPFNFFTSLGYAPMLNKFNHTMSNYMNDTTGEVPDGGTCMIWDGGSHEKMSEEERQSWRTHDEYFLKSGGDPKILKR